jgi:hypothetical protein
MPDTQNVPSGRLVRFYNGVRKEKLVTPAALWIRLTATAGNIDFVLQ